MRFRTQLNQLRSSRPVPLLTSRQGTDCYYSKNCALRQEHLTLRLCLNVFTRLLEKLGELLGKSINWV